MSGLLGSGSNSQPAPIMYTGLNVSSSRRDIPIPIMWGQRRLSTNAIWYNDFQQHSTGGGKGGGKGGGGGKGSGQYDYTAATIVALGEGPIDSIPRSWASGSTTTTSSLSQLNQTFFPGSATQSPWSYAESNYPSQARSYALTAYLACPKMDLGASAEIPDNGYECVRTSILPYYRTTSAGWIDPNSHAQASAVDVLISDVIVDLLTNVQYEVGYSAGDIGSITQFATYQRAQGIFFSPMLDGSRKGTEVIDGWAALANAWIYEAGGQLQFVPLGDSAITGNGVTYTPQNDVAYNLGPDDYLKDGPLKITRTDPADCFNRTLLNITDRTLGYISNPVEYKDDRLVGKYGLRDGSTTDASDICDPAVAAIVAQLIGKRAAYIRNSYSFKTSFRFIRCLPGTVITLTEPAIGVSMVRVRVKTIDEADDGSLSFTCEEFPSNVGTPGIQNALPVNTATTPNRNAAPGSVNTPAIFEPDASFTNGSPEIIIAVSGGPNWGGANAHISFDDAHYSSVGKITVGAIQGVLSASLASHVDPDTADTLAIDCTQSLSPPTPVTTADADALRTISWVSPQPTLTGGIEVMPTTGEMLAFGDVTGSGTYTANLTYLRRGKYGFAPMAHSAGDQFTVISALETSRSVIAYTLPVQYIGQPIYFKFTSFNVFEGAEEDISTVATYCYTPTGLGFGGSTGGAPRAPTGLTLTPTAFGNIGTSWTANAATDHLLNYELYRAPGLAASFSAATLIWTGSALSYADANVSSGSGYTYFLIAQNAVGPSSPTSGVSTTATSGSVTSGVAGTIALTGTIDGTNKVFTMASGIPVGAIPLLSVNGTYQQNVTNFSISGTTLTFVTAPVIGATLALSYTVISIPNFSYL